MNSQISVLDKKVKLIVYIPCFGYERFVKKVIKSLKNQSFKKYICKVYVLKNDEKAIDIVNGEINNDKRFFVEKLAETPTMQELGNLVLKNSISEYILRLDADDTLDEFGIQILISTADKDIDIAMIWGCCYY